MPHVHWTEEDVKKLKDAHAQGKTAQQIIQLFNGKFNANSVRSKMTNLGLKSNRARKRKHTEIKSEPTNKGSVL